MTRTTMTAARDTLVTLQNPDGPPVPDSEGGFTQPYADLGPAKLWGAVADATARDLERIAAGTVIATASHVVTIPFHPDVTTKTRLSWQDRAGRSHTANVTGVQNPDQQCVELVLICVELVP